MNHQNLLILLWLLYALSFKLLFEIENSILILFTTRFISVALFFQSDVVFCHFSIKSNLSFSFAILYRLIDYNCKENEKKQE